MIKFYGIKTRKKDELLIYCYIRKKDGGKLHKLIIPTGIRVKTTNWDKRAQRIKMNDPNFHYKNNKINQMYLAIESRCLQLDFKTNIEQTFKEIKALFEKTPSIFLNELVTNYINGRGHLLSHKYKQKIQTLLKHLEGFGNTTIGELNNNFVDKFVKFLIERDVTDDTIERMLNNLKIVIKWNFGRFIEPIDLKHLKYKAPKNVTTFAITTNELKQLANINTKTNLEQKTLDLFIICCLTGLRISDAVKINKHLIENNLYTIVQTKTKQELVVYFPDLAIKILDKYSTNEPFKDFLQQKGNAVLKLLARRAGLNRQIQLVYFKGHKRIEKVVPISEKISFHTGRRTFATILATENISDALVRKLTGHRTASEHDKYIKPAPQQVEQLKNKFNNIFALLN